MTAPDEGGGASRSTDPAAGSSAATDVSLREFIGAIRDGDMRLWAERDRRYTEVGVEREKALKIKETADLAALGLAREIQTYKDEKANELRSQIERERGTYATKDDLNSVSDKFEIALKPIAEYVVSQQGRSQGIGVSAGVIVGALAAVGTVIGIIVVLANVLTTQ